MTIAEIALPLSLSLRSTVQPTTVNATSRGGTLLCTQLASLRARAAGMTRGSCALRSAAGLPHAARDTLTSSSRGSAGAIRKVLLGPATQSERAAPQRHGSALGNARGRVGAMAWVALNKN